MYRLENATNEKNIVIAAACGTNAPRLSPKLRDKINSKIKDILPPQDIDTSERLSEAGEFVVPYLRCNESLTSDERYFCLNTLRMISSPQALLTAGSYLNASAEKREINLVGNMIDGYTRKEIQSIYFEKIVRDYIRVRSSSGSLYIPESFLQILWPTSANEISKYASEFTELTIVGFQNRVNRKVLSLFSKTNSLNIVGCFDSISSLADISMQLTSLEICDHSDRFDFYEINKYPLDSLKRFQFFSNRSVYFSGCDCGALKNISDLGLFFYNPLSEIFFDGFGSFTNLKSFSLYHEDVAEESDDPQVYCLSTAFRLKDVQRFVIMTSKFQPPFLLAKGHTTCVDGVSCKTSDWKPVTGSHVDWWLYLDAKPWLAFEETIYEHEKEQQNLSKTK